MIISAKETWRRIRQLRPEFGTDRAIAQHLNLPRLRLDEWGRSAVRVRTMIRVRRLHRQMLLIGLDSDAPDVAL